MVYVSNRGGRRPQPSDTTAPTSGSQALTDPVTGTTISGTVSVIDEETLTPREIEVGRAPSGMALSPDESTAGHRQRPLRFRLASSNTETLKTIEVKIPAYPEGVTGSQPIAVASLQMATRMYVACAGTNAIARAKLRRELEGRRDRFPPAGSRPP